MASVVTTFTEEQEDSLRRLAQAAAGPEAFLAPEDDLAEVVRKAAKACYDQTAKFAPKGNGVSALEELYVDGFDAEQVWQQIDMQNRSVVRRIRRLHGRFKDVQDLSEEELSILFRVSSGREAEGVGDERSRSFRSIQPERHTGQGRVVEEASDDSSSEDTAGENKHDASAEESDDNSTDAHGSDSDAERSPILAPTEDEYFRLEEMEEFVQDAEEAEEKGNQQGVLDDEDDESESDGFSDEVDEILEGNGGEMDSEDEDDEELQMAMDLVDRRTKNNRKKARRENEDDLKGSLAPYMATDFFLPQKKATSGKQRDLSKDMGPHTTGKKVRFEADSKTVKLPPEKVDLEEEPPVNGAGIRKSTHEIRVERMAEKIRKLEEENMAQKGWELSGEIHANQRPLNSALEVDLEFDHARPAPAIMTEEITETIEDIIKQRIVEGRFDDVVRLSAPSEKDKDRKKQKELGESEKSAKGLGELYEEDYMKQQYDLPVNEKEEALRLEARALFNKLAQKLDALSHFHFAPRPVVEELAVKDIPALAIEEVGPAVASLAASKAPEEVYHTSNAGVPKAEEEYTREERRARRARKKRKQKAMHAEREEKRRLKALAVAAAGGGSVGAKMVSAGIIPSRSAVPGSGSGLPPLRKAKLSTAPVATKSGDVFKLLQKQQDPNVTKDNAKAKVDQRSGGSSLRL